MTTTHIMLDIETLGTRPGFVVLSAAFVRFSDTASTSLVLSRPDQVALGLEEDPATREWWLQQSPAARDAATVDPVPLADALGHFHAWLEWAAGGGQINLWCHGASFDAPMLQELYRRVGASCPWGFRDVRDTRTLFDLAGVDVRSFYDGVAHCALSDAIAQTKAAIRALEILSSRSVAA